MAKLQCPNCGGYKSEELGSFGRLFGKLFNAILALIGLLIVALVLGAMFGSMVAIIVMAICVIVLLWEVVSSFQPGKASCLLCGFKWSKSDYPSGTKFRVQQDLIKKGNIRLVQERLEREQQRRREEERKKQEELYYNQRK
jgi:hypothetical protein